MGKGLSFLESPATPEEDSFDYRVEWDDYVEISFDENRKLQAIHHGGGSRFFSHDFDAAWELYGKFLDDSSFVNVHLIKIYPDGSEMVHS